MPDAHELAKVYYAAARAEVVTRLAMREQVLLATPVKLVCREDCKGLCPHCGSNLNVEPCNCQQPSDPRWAALSDLKNKLQS